MTERAAILGDGRRLEVAAALGNAPRERPRSAPDPVRSTRVPSTLSNLDDAMRQHIESALAKTSGRIEGERGAAKILGIKPHTLRARMRKLRIDWQGFRNLPSEGG